MSVLQPRALPGGRRAPLGKLTRPRRNPRPEAGAASTPRPAFTLIEIVLAIALASTVMYLLVTAIELFLVRVDSSRSQTESAQLARTILDQMADDLSNARLYAPVRSTDGGDSSGSGSPGGGSSAGENPSPSGAGGSGNSSSGGSDASTSFDASDVSGIFGTAEEIRIDRTAYTNWERATRDVELEETAASGDRPLSVRYYLGDGDFYTPERMAQRGTVEEEDADQIAGLYRDTAPTAALDDEDDPLAAMTQTDVAHVELLAPEVVKLELAYFDGTDLVAEWDTFDEEGLPGGVEIRLTMYEPSARTLNDPERIARAREGRYNDDDVVEYRRFVRVPNISPQQDADVLLPAQDEGSDDGPTTAFGSAGQGSQPSSGQSGQSGQDGNQNSGQGNQPGGSRGRN
jgi:type II secretory pathway pseudopilin PulG